MSALSWMLAASLLSQGQAKAKTQEWTKKLDVGPVAVRVDAPATMIGLSETIEVSVTMVAPERVAIKIPDLTGMLGTCKVLGARVEGPDKLDRFLARRWFLRLEPLRLGRCDLGTVTIEYKDGALDWQRGTVPLPALQVVQGPTSSADPATLRPIPSLPDPGEAAPWPQRLRWGGAALFVIVVLLWIRSALKTRPASMSAVQQALQALTGLERSDLLVTAGPRRFVEQATQIVRHYLEQAYGLAATHQTTIEFLASEPAKAVLTAGQRIALAELLESADVSKFAGPEPNAATCATCLRRARAFFAGEPMDGPAAG